MRINDFLLQEGACNVDFNGYLKDLALHSEKQKFKQTQQTFSTSLTGLLGWRSVEHRSERVLLPKKLESHPTATQKESRLLTGNLTVKNQAKV